MSLKTSQNDYCCESVHSKLGFTLGLISIIIIFYIGYPYIYETDTFFRQFGILAIFESVFAFIGLFFTDIFICEKNQFKKKLKNDHIYSLIFGIFLFFMIGLIPNLSGVIDFAISDTEIDIFIVLCAPAEELFFRGFILSIFIKFNKNSKFKFNFSENKYISILPIIAIILSSILFVRIHVFDYNNISFLLQLFIGGILLGTFYWFTRDLTACILAHLFVNIMAVYGYHILLISIGLISICYLIVHFTRYIKEFPNLDFLEGMYR